MATLTGPARDVEELTPDELAIIQAIQTVDQGSLAAFLISNIRHIMRQQQVNPVEALAILLQRGVIPNAKIVI